MNNNLRVLVADDERLSRATAQHQLTEHNYIADTAENGQQALEKIKTGQWDVLVSDIRMPGMDGLQLLKEVRQDHPDVSVILITAFGSVETAVSAIKEGAADYLTKPFRFPELEFRLRKIKELRDTRKEIKHLREYLDSTETYYKLVGQSAMMKTVFDRIQIFANNTVPVLIVGETGTGKELVSRALHLQSPRTDASFIPVSCGAIPRDLAESELFGHEKGSFTGALQRRIGHFERAHKGTLLLDDVDDLPLEIQAKLLRVLQEGTISRIGGEKEIHIDVRLIATTKVDLGELVESGGFRKDLFYRLRGMEIHLPALRNRDNDILLLAQHFLNMSTRDGSPHQNGLSKEAAELLRNYEWPGNVREMRRVMESATVLSRGEEIRCEHLPDYLQELNPARRQTSSRISMNLEGCETLDFNGLIREAEDELIQWALAKSNGQQSLAADLLDLPRTTFQSKLNRKRKEKTA